MAAFSLSRKALSIIKVNLILFGVLLTSAAAIGTRTYVAPAEAVKSAAEGRIAGSANMIEVLRNAISQYYALEQQTSLINALEINVKDELAHGIIDKMQRAAFLEQAGPIRQIISQLSLIEGVSREPAREHPYAALVERCTKDYTRDNVAAVVAAERAIIDSAQTLSGKLVTERLGLLQANIREGAEVERRKLVLLVMQSIGSAILVLAYLF